jgi:HSP20 family protein
MNAPRQRPRGGPIPFPEQMEKMFDCFARGPRRRIWQQFRRGEEWSPDIDAFERGNATIVRADLPGVKRENLEVSVEGNTLLIEGRREEPEAKEENYYSERPVGRFSRTVQLPEGVDPTLVTATYEDGVLELTVPHPPIETPKTVKVPIT